MSWQIINAIPINGSEYILIGHNEKSPTPWATWQGKLHDFNCGHYFLTKGEALADMSERVEFHS